jgi:hypothetical protein
MQELKTNHFNVVAHVAFPRDSHVCCSKKSNCYSNFSCCYDDGPKIPCSPALKAKPMPLIDFCFVANSSKASYKNSTELDLNNDLTLEY